MKSTGRYTPVEDKFDIDHEINHFVNILNIRILNDLKFYHKEDMQKIKEALVETINEI